MPASQVLKAASRAGSDQTTGVCVTNWDAGGAAISGTVDGAAGAADRGADGIAGAEGGVWLMDNPFYKAPYPLNRKVQPHCANC